MNYNAIANHYDILIDENNAPVHDPGPLKTYMDKWDRLDFINKMEVSTENPSLKLELHIFFCVKKVRKCEEICLNSQTNSIR